MYSLFRINLAFESNSTVKFATFMVPSHSVILTPAGHTAYAGGNRLPKPNTVASLVAMSFRHVCSKTNPYGPRRMRFPFVKASELSFKANITYFAMLKKNI